MIRLEAGSLKYLLVDHKEVLRNSERIRRFSPTVIVAEVTPEGTKLHRGYSLATSATLTYTSSPKTPLLTVRMQPHYEDEKVYSAFHTDGAVDIDDGEDSTVSVPTDTKPKTSPAKAKPTIKKETPKPNGEE